MKGKVPEGRMTQKTGYGKSLPLSQGHENSDSTMVFHAISHISIVILILMLNSSSDSDF